MITVEMTQAPSWSVLHGNAIDQLRGMEPDSVQTFVTSVPYWSLRRYIDHPDEIGREDTLQEWLDNLVEVFGAARVPLRPDGTLWINCGDSYASGGCGGSDHHLERMSTKTAQAQILGRKSPPAGYKDKDLLGLPWRLAFALQEDGWYLRSAIPWVKGVDWLDAEREAQDRVRQALDAVRHEAMSSLFGLSDELARTLDRAEKAIDRLLMSGSAMPESVTDRPTSTYEMLFLFSQAPHYYYDHHAIKVPQVKGTRERMKAGFLDRYANGAVDARGYRGPVGGKSGMSYCPAGRNARNVWMIPWRIPNEPQGTFVLSDGTEVAHFAAYPQVLVERAIKASTSAAGCCRHCNAPFERVTRPTAEYAAHLGQDWADYDQDQEEGRGHFDGAQQRPVKRNAPALTAQYLTIGWVPTCTCYGKPVEGMIDCPGCYGTGMAIADTCPTCVGTGQVPGQVWPDELLENWPRKPCVAGDMFAGSGTTGRGALALGRSTVLIDLHPDYVRLISERLDAFPDDVEQVRGSGSDDEPEVEPEYSPQLSFALGGDDANAK